MTLEEKGKIIPPPKMSLHLQTVSEAIQQWKGIIAASHWDLYDRSRVDGADFYVGNQELGHIHLNGEVHLATTDALCKPLVRAGLAEKFPYGAGWVLHRITNKTEAKHAVWLFNINYQRLTGVPLADILPQIATHV